MSVIKKSSLVHLHVNVCPVKILVIFLYNLKKDNKPSVESKFNIFGNLKSTSFQNKNDKSKLGGIFSSDVALKQTKKCNILNKLVLIYINCIKLDLYF